MKIVKEDLKVKKCVESYSDNKKLVEKYYVVYLHRNPHMDILKIYKHENDGDIWYSYESELISSDERFANTDQAYVGFQWDIRHQYPDMRIGSNYNIFESKARAQKLFDLWFGDEDTDTNKSHDHLVRKNYKGIKIIYHDNGYGDYEDTLWLIDEIVSNGYFDYSDIIDFENIVDEKNGDEYILMTTKNEGKNAYDYIEGRLYPRDE